MFRQLFRKILKTAEGLLRRIRKASFRAEAVERVGCQRDLSILCGIWNQHRRENPVLIIDPKYRSNILSEYAGIGLLMRPLQNYSFQDPTTKSIEILENSLDKMVILISQGKVIGRNKQ